MPGILNRIPIRGLDKWTDQSSVLMLIGETSSEDRGLGCLAAIGVGCLHVIDGMVNATKNSGNTAELQGTISTTAIPGSVLLL